MPAEYYWDSIESARQRRWYYANPAPRSWFRFKRALSGEFSTHKYQWTPPAILDAPGYYTVMCMDTGSIFEYTERHKNYDTRPTFEDASYVGQYYFDRTIILRHKDGAPGRYKIGFGGVTEHDLTPEWAIHVVKACQDAQIPVPSIKGIERILNKPPQAMTR